MEILKLFRVNLDLKRVTAQAEPLDPLIVEDTGNVFLVTLTDSGEPVDLTNCRVLAVFSTPDRKTAEQDETTGLTIEGEENNVVRIAVRTGSFGAGQNSCELQIYSGEQYETLVTSASFNFDGRRGIVNGETVVAQDNFPILLELQRQTEALLDRLEVLVVENGDMIKAIYDVNENGIVDDAERLGGELPEHYATAAGTEAMQAVLRQEIDTLAEVVETLNPDDIGAATVRDYRVTIPASGWSETSPYTQTLSVPGLTAEIAPELWFVPPDTAEAREAQRDAAACISLLETGADSLTVTCDEDLPEADVQILLREVF